MSCRDPSDDACAVARHAEHLGGLGGSVCARGVQRASNNLKSKKINYFRQKHALWAALRSAACGGASRRSAAPSIAARRFEPPLRGATRPARCARLVGRNGAPQAADTASFKVRNRRRLGRGEGRSAQHTLQKYTIRCGIVDLVGVEHLRKPKGALYYGLLVPRLGAFRAVLGASVQLRLRRHRAAWQWRAAAAAVAGSTSTAPRSPTPAAPPSPLRSSAVRCRCSRF